MSVPGPQHRCSGCGIALAVDNTARLCGKCHRDSRDQLRAAPLMPAEFFETDEFRVAFASRHIGNVFKAYRNHFRHLKLFGKALNQEILGRWLGLTQAQVSRLENGKAEQNLDTLRKYAQVLRLPQHMLRFDFPGQSRLRYPPSPDRPDYLLSRDIDSVTAEILDSSTADEAIDQLSLATRSLAESHTQAPAGRVLEQVLRLHEQAQLLLGGRQRLGQRRELFRIESDLLAHACLLLDDVKQNAVAQRYGAAALSFVKEAG